MSNRKLIRNWKWINTFVITLSLAIGIFLVQAEPSPGEIDTTQWKKASFPVAEFQDYTSPFGRRKRPCPTCSEYHKGLDIVGAEGSDLTAWWGGKVIKVGFDAHGWGNYLVILSGKWEHLYGHCQQILTKEGKTVKTGEIIAKAGSTGGVTGPHLHWELRHQTAEQANISDSSQWTLINPAEVLWRMYKAYYPNSNISKVGFRNKSTPDDAMETY